MTMKEIAYGFLGAFLLAFSVAFLNSTALYGDPGIVPDNYNGGNTLIVEGRDLEYREAAELLLDNERLRSRVEWLENLLGRVAADLEVIQSYIKVTTPE